MKKKYRNRKKNKSYQRPFKTLNFPQAESEIPAFENALMEEFNIALSKGDPEVRVKFAFPGRSQGEAQRLGSEYSRLFEKNFAEVLEKWGIKREQAPRLMI